MIGLRTEIGYQIARTDEAFKNALRVAFDLVKRARQAGAETRSWAIKAEKQTKDLVMQARAIEKSRKSHGAISKELAGKMWQLNCWENNILQAIRSYMTDTTNWMEKLGKLNPPLSSNHLKPFLEAMVLDRKGTIASLEPVTQHIQELIQIKSEFKDDSPQINNYNPI